MSLPDWAKIAAAAGLFAAEYFQSAPTVEAIPPRPDITGREETGRQLANRYGRIFGVPPRLLLSIWRIESGFDPLATNMIAGDLRRGGAWGLGQMTLRTAQDLTASFPMVAAKYWPAFQADPAGESLFNVQENAAMSAFLLSIGFQEFGGNPFATGLSYKMGLRYVADLLKGGGRIPEDLTSGGQRYFGRLVRACRAYA